MPKQSTSEVTIFEKVPETTKGTFANLALVELFGHQRVVGMVTVDPAEFPGMVRVDVPDMYKNGKIARKGLTRYIGRAALYGMTPIDEKTMLILLPDIDGRPAMPMQIGEYDGD